MTTSQGGDVARASVSPGLKAGQSNEFTLIMPLKPGGAERMRKNMSDAYKAETNQKPIV